MKKSDIASDREKVFRAVREYFKMHGTGEKQFVPGRTPVKYGSRIYDETELVYAVDSILSFWLTADKYAARFEAELGKFVGCSHCLMVNSGSSANLLAFASLTSPLLGKRAIRKGDEVVTPALCFPTTVAPVMQFGAVPVFTDVELETANISTAFAAEAVSRSTRAVMAAHTLGSPFRADKMRKFCEDRRLWLVEDNCDALGAECAGKRTGSFGHIGTSSFYPAHHITAGEGGAAYTSDPLLAKIMMSVRDWGRDCHCPPGRDNTCGKRFTGKFGRMPRGYDHKYIYSHLGYNLKATEMQAAIACAQMAKLPSFVAKRNRNHAILREILENEGLGDRMIFHEAAKGTKPSWFGFMMTMRDGGGLDRNAMAGFLESAKIQTRNLFGGNIIRQPCFASLREGRDYRVSGDLRNTDKIMNDSLWVGIYPGQTEEKIRYIALKIKEYAAKCTRTRCRKK